MQKKATFKQVAEAITELARSAVQAFTINSDDPTVNGGQRSRIAHGDVNKRALNEMREQDRRDRENAQFIEKMKPFAAAAAVALGAYLMTHPVHAEEVSVPKAPAAVTVASSAPVAGLNF